jgi:hypothetical protein
MYHVYKNPFCKKIGKVHKKAKLGFDMHWETRSEKSDYKTLLIMEVNKTSILQIIIYNFVEHTLITFFHTFKKYSSREAVSLGNVSMS